jgi:hypothetical protein
MSKNRHCLGVLLVRCSSALKTDGWRTSSSLDCSHSAAESDHRGCILDPTIATGETCRLQARLSVRRMGSQRIILYLDITAAGCIVLLPHEGEKDRVRKKWSGHVAGEFMPNCQYLSPLLVDKASR